MITVHQFMENSYGSVRFFWVTLMIEIHTWKLELLETNINFHISIDQIKASKMKVKRLKMPQFQLPWVQKCSLCIYTTIFPSVHLSINKYIKENHKGNYSQMRVLELTLLFICCYTSTYFILVQLKWFRERAYWREQKKVKKSFYTKCIKFYIECINCIAYDRLYSMHISMHNF